MTCAVMPADCVADLHGQVVEDGAGGDALEALDSNVGDLEGLRPCRADGENARQQQRHDAVAFAGDLGFGYCHSTPGTDRPAARRNGPWTDEARPTRPRRAMEKTGAGDPEGSE
jgi:hypothetical protein